jgi:hypothetical protein
VRYVPLKTWNFWWLGVDYDPASGRGRLRRAPDEMVGWAYWSRLQWHTLWNNDGRLCLQVGQRRWFADEGWTARIDDYGPVRMFSLVRGTECALRRRYSRLAVGIGAILDDDDGERADFFRWASRTWHDVDRQKQFLTWAWTFPRGPMPSSF